MDNKTPSKTTVTQQLYNASSLVTLCLLLAIFFVNFVGRILPSPLMPVIESELQIDHSTAGAYWLAMSAGYSVMLFVGQLLTARLSHKQIIVLSSVGVGFVLIGNLVVTSGVGLALFFFLLGAASGLYIPSGITLTTAVVATSSWGVGIAIHELAPSLGYLTVPVLAEGILEATTWRIGLALVGLCSIIIGAIYSFLGQGENLHGARLSVRSARRLIERKGIRISIALFGLAMAVNYGLYVMMPLYMVAERGWARETANLLISLSRLPALAGMLISGVAVDRFGPKRIIWTSLFLSGIASIVLAIGPNRWLNIVIPTQAFLIVAFFPAGFALLSKETDLSTRNIGVALITAVSTLFGQGIIPLLVGVLGDSGSFSNAFIAVGIVSTLGAFLIRLIDSTQNEKPKKICG